MSDEASWVLGVVLYENSPESLARLTRSLDLVRSFPGSPSFVARFLDHSQTDSPQRREAVARDYSRFDFQGANRGFGAGQNRLLGETWPRTRTQAFVCVNPDALLHPACLVELAAERDRHPKTGLVEARQLPLEHQKFYHPRTHATTWCSGCVLLITRELYENIGGFDERFFMYCEDVDYSWRARERGFGTYLAPRAWAHHAVEGRPSNRAKDRQVHKSAAFLGAKYGARAFAKEHYDKYRVLGGEPFDLPRGRVMKEADFEHGLAFAEERW